MKLVLCQEGLQQKLFCHLHGLMKRYESKKKKDNYA